MLFPYDFYSQEIIKHKFLKGVKKWQAIEFWNMDTLVT